MTPSRPENAPNPQLPVPPAGAILLFLVALGWFAAAPILVEIGAIWLPANWPDMPARLLMALALAGLLLLPSAGLLALANRRNWPGFKPLALALAATALYLSAGGIIRAAAAPGDTLTALLHALALTPLALLLGGLALQQAGVPGWLLPHASGLDRPTLAGLLLALAATAVITLGWPVTGALGDSWASEMLLLQTLARTLPDVIFFFGAVLGIITFNFQHKKALAALATLLIYLAGTLCQIVPHHDWWQLFLPLTALPLALLLIELRAGTGSIWAGLLLAVAVTAAPPLFTDPRDEMPLITQPWQTAARLWMLVAMLGIVVVLWLIRQFIAPRRQVPELLAAALAAMATVTIWAGLWLTVGYPGFYNDGFLIIMSEQADLSGVTAIAEPLARREFVRQHLLDVARRTQPPVVQALNAAGLSYRQFYIINMIRVDGQHRRMDEFAHLPGVARVMRNPNVRPYPITFKMPYNADTQPGPGVGWNIRQINADAVWKLGITGQGIVVAGQDTGYDLRHLALLKSYRGYNGTDRVNNNYNWHDAWGSDDTGPIDDDRHGTHTMGTILGDDGQGNQIGVAPGAKWIGCRNMRRGIGNPASYADCMEFFLAPYPVGGNPFTAGEVTQAPHVINNSWGCPEREGCDQEVLKPATAALRAAGIMMVVSAGNDGPACQTVTDPPATYNTVFSVGATDEQGQITGFSSRGPVGAAQPLLKPDIAAPGAGVRSSIPGGGYALADGTSMAGPHVTGLVALLWSANPALIGQIEATEKIIRESAHPTPVAAACAPATPSSLPLANEFAALSDSAPCACGNVTGTPNNVFGWGQIDAEKAVRLAQAYKP